MKTQLRTLSESELETIHQASLRILESTGLSVGAPEALDVLKKAGAKVDETRRVAKLPAGLVRDALSMAPKSFHLMDLRGRVLPLPTDDPYLTSRLALPEILDYGAENTRPPVVQDIVNLCRIAEALPAVDAVFKCDCAISDVPSEMNDVVAVATALSNTCKLQLCIPISISSARVWAEIAELATQSGDLNKEPIIMTEVSTTSPLQLDEQSARVLLYMCGKGVPMATLPMPMSGGTAPYTLAGTMVMQNAEALFLITLAQLVRPGTPVLYGGIPVDLWMPTGNISMGSPEFPITNGAMVQLGKFYQLPCYSATAYTDSTIIDVQCGFEKGMECFWSIACGTDLGQVCGDLKMALIVSYEQVIIDHDIWLATKRMSKGIQVNPDTLALELIESIGPGGEYLSSEHTLRYLRSGEHWLHGTFNRRGAGEGAKSMLQAAHEKVEQILAGPWESPVPDAIVKKIDDYVNVRAKELLGRPWK